MASIPNRRGRPAFLSAGIRPSFHAIVGWIILVSVSALLTALVAGAFGDLSRSRAQIAAYSRDCAGITVANPGNSAGPCYIATLGVSYDMPDIGEGATGMYADLDKPIGVRSQRTQILGSFDPNRLPMSGKTQVQVWQLRITKVKIDGKWRLTSDNPTTHIGPGLFVLLLLAMIILWAATFWMLVLMVKGFAQMRRELATDTEETTPIFRSPMS